MTIFLQGQKKSSGWGSIGAGLGKGLGESLESAQEERKKDKYQDEENQAAKKLGINLTGIRDPQTRREVLLQGIKSKYKSEEGDKDLLSNRSIISDLENRRGLESGSLKAYENDPAMAERVTKPTKEPKKTQASQPIDPEQLNLIENVRNDPSFDKASPSKKYQMLTGKGVSRENAKAEADIAAEEEKIGAETKKAEAKENQRKEDIVRQERELFHKESHNYDEKLKNDAKTAQLQNRSLQRQMENVDKLGWYDRAVSLLGNSAMGTVLKSKNAQEFDANTLYQMEGLRQILGGVLSDSDIRLLLQKIVTSDKNPEANKTIAKNMMFENNLKIAKDMIGNEIRSSNGGYRPSNYESEIERIYQERYGNSIQDMFNEVMSLSDDKKKINEFRRKVPPGTSLNDNSVKMYYELANGDPEKATKLAEEDGYDIPK